MSGFDTYYLKVNDANEASTILKQCRQSFGERGDTWDFNWLTAHTTIVFKILPGSKANTILRLKYSDKLTTSLVMYSTGYQNTAIGGYTPIEHTTGYNNTIIGQPNKFKK